MSGIIKVLIVDDHEVVREGTELLLDAADEVRVVGKAADGKEALGLIRALRPDVMLLDLLMPGPEPVEVVKAALKAHPEIRVLMVSGSAQTDQIMEAIRAGAMGYLSKESSREDYIAAISRLHRGEPFLPADLTRKLIHEPERDSESVLEELTEREQEILRLVALGWDNHKIADHLHIAEVTARTHLSRLLTKVGVTNRVQAALFALIHGLAHLDEAEDLLGTRDQ